MEEVVGVFRKRKFEVRTETKMKGNGEVSWYRVCTVVLVRVFKRMKALEILYPIS